MKDISIWRKRNMKEQPFPGSATATSDKQISMIFQGQITVFKD